MATSTIKFYKNTLLNINQNFMYSETRSNSNFETFLNKSLKQTINDFQYIKHGLDISVKIKEQQSDLYNQATQTLPYNYCSIKNSDDNKIYYYYVVTGTWKSKNCVEYLLSMDTVASFWDEIQYNMNDQTNVVREHRDRFFKKTGTITDGTKLIRKIDPISEGIQITNKRLVSDKILNDEELPADVNKWYLVYRTEVNANDLNNNPIKCYLCSNELLSVQTPGITKLSLKDLDTNFTYYFINEEANGNGGVQFNIQYSPGTIQTTNFVLNTEKTSSKLKVIRILYKDDKWYVKALYYSPDNTYIGGQSVEQWPIQDSDITFTGNMTIGYSVNSNIENDDYYYYLYNKELSNTGKIYINAGIHQWYNFVAVDRTDSRLNMIIELPYCPDDTIYHNSITDVYSYNENVWVYSKEYNMLRLLDLNSTFYRTLIQEYEVPDLIFTVDTDKVSNSGFNNNDMESKIYHSDFSQLQYIYDNFPISIDRERLIVNENNNNDPTFTIGYKQANNLTSNLLMEIKDSQNERIKLSKVQNHEYIAISNRNNEIPVYQSSYLNYMRTGYNYDKKAQAIANRQQTINAIGSLLQTGSAITAGVRSNIGTAKIAKTTRDLIFDEMINEAASLQRAGVSPYSPEGQQALDDWTLRGKRAQAAYIETKYNLTGTSTQLMIQNSSSIVGQISSMITTRQSQENSMNQKLAELASQQASTSGSNDLDLFNYYDKNKLHELKYELTDLMKQPIYDLFYYLGYTTNIQKKPDLYSRSLFNYIMASPEFNITVNYPTIPQQYVEDIKTRFNNGLTVWHVPYMLYGQNNTEKWIIDQLPEE